MQIEIYSPEQQGTGEFDGGKITEQKPIGFPGEKTAVKRVGPLFYWAWAFAKKEGYIPPHPHHAFEIMTYVIQGRAEHGDSLGTRSNVGPGGAQVMQTGSGVYHEERFIGPDMEGFQIWFEPYLQEAHRKPPTYRQYEHEDFPAEMSEGLVVKTLIGAGSPVSLATDVKMWDIAVQPGQAYVHQLPAGRSLAALAVRGNGEWAEKQEQMGEAEEADEVGSRIQFQHKYFVVIHADAATEATLRPIGGQELRMVIIEVPTEVDYPLYPRR